nr:hypothetical protein [Tanacetum cinerariifolium]
MADVNAPSSQTPAMVPPVRADDQIFPHIRWVPIGKSNCYLDLEKLQGNPIYKITVELLKNTNFFRAYTASSTIPSIYIQQEALQITPVNNNQAFTAPPSTDGLINFVNQLGYPKLVRNLSNVVTNDLFQPWRILWGVVTRSNIDYAERIWEKFTQSIHTFIEDKRNLSWHTSRKKRATLIMIPSIWFIKLIIHHLQRRHRFHPRPDSPLNLPNEEPVLRYPKFSAKECYKCLDEQWFVLTKDTLREALQITPVNSNQAFAAPPTSKGLINFVNELGYPKLVRNLSNVVTNDLFQPWRALLTIINLCLMGKTSGFERPRAPVLQILWGVVTRTNIDYAGRIWEEFTQSIHTFIEDKRNLSWHTSGKKRATLIMIPSIQFTKLIIHHLQRRHMFHPRPDSPLHLPNEEPVLGYLKFSAKGTKREVFEIPIPGPATTSAQPAPTSAPAKP